MIHENSVPYASLHSNILSYEKEVYKKYLSKDNVNYKGLKEAIIKIEAKNSSKYKSLVTFLYRLQAHTNKVPKIHGQKWYCDTCAKSFSIDYEEQYRLMWLYIMPRRFDLFLPSIGVQEKDIFRETYNEIKYGQRNSMHQMIDPIDIGMF